VGMASHHQYHRQQPLSDVTHPLHIEISSGQIKMSRRLNGPPASVSMYHLR
jgi:hypothetical protein